MRKTIADEHPLCFTQAVEKGTPLANGIKTMFPLQFDERELY
jgi:hypothetical protein